MGQPIWDRPIRDADTVRLASDPRPPLTFFERYEGRILLGWIAFSILASVIGAYFIALPHEGDWMVEGWLRYTLWLMPGVCIVGFFLVLERKSPGMIEFGNLVFGVITGALLAGFLISQPHAGSWFGEWMLISGGALVAIIFGIAALTSFAESDIRFTDD
jgi:hypothetical protein